MKRYIFAGTLFIVQQAFANNNAYRAFFCDGENAPLPQTEQPDSASHKLRHHIAFDFRPDYILPTNNYQRGLGGVVPPSTTLAVNLKYGFRFAPDSYFGRNYPHTVQGIGVGYHTFFNPSMYSRPHASPRSRAGCLWTMNGISVFLWDGKNMIR